MIGREIHEKRGEQNKNYLPKKIGSIHKMIGVNLVSEKYGIKEMRTKSIHLLMEQWHHWIINLPGMMKDFQDL